MPNYSSVSFVISRILLFYFSLRSQDGSVHGDGAFVPGESRKEPHTPFILKPPAKKYVNHFNMAPWWEAQLLGGIIIGTGRHNWWEA